MKKCYREREQKISTMFPQYVIIFVTWTVNIEVTEQWTSMSDCMPAPDR